MVQDKQARSKSSSWDDISKILVISGPPLRPTDDDVAVLARIIAGRDQDVLLLGVTPELASLGTNLTAVDKSARMIETMWPGDSARRRVIMADWLNLPLETGRFSAVVGDASLNAVEGDLCLLAAEIKRVLAPTGVAVFRTSFTPELTEDLDVIRSDIENGWHDNFRAFKWRIAMSLADQAAQGDVPAARIRDVFNEMFPDRERLCAMTGWNPVEVAGIDFYAGVTSTFKFPKLSVFMDLLSPVFPSIKLIPAQGYPLAERFYFTVLAAEP